MAVLFSCVASDLSAARGTRDKRNPGKGKPDSAASAQEKPTTSNMNSALLISVPRNTVSLEKDTTIAFIEFNHIAHRVTVVDSEESDICAAQVAAALAQHLADLGRFQVVTRDHIGSVLEEINFANSGSVNTSTSARLGELIGADILIYGLVQLCTTNTIELQKLAEQQRANSYLQNTQLPTEQPDPANQLIQEAKKELMPQGKHSGLFDSAVDYAVGKFRDRRNGREKNGAEDIEKPEDDDSKKPRSLVLAQVQLIEAATGKHILTASLRGEFVDKNNKPGLSRDPRELIAHASDDLANKFIDYFLARPERRDLVLYAEGPWGFKKGIDLIQLGDCARAEKYFLDVYDHFRDQMNNQTIAQLMYNHGIALMCSDRSEEALHRLWASLRLAEDRHPIYEAIHFTNDTIDHGRRIMVETDPIVEDVRVKMYPLSRVASASLVP